MAGNGIGIDNSGVFNSGNGNDVFEGKARARTSQLPSLLGGDPVKGRGGNAIGIKNTGNLLTGRGADRFIATAASEVVTQGTGERRAVGLQNQHLLNTGDGNDVINASGKSQSNTPASGVGLENIADAVIQTGRGNDTLTGSGSSFGINNEGTIKTGPGRDIVTGLGPDAFTGFSGGGTIHLGDGSDEITGFGTQTVDGGRGRDEAKFSFDLTETVTLGSSAANTLDVTVNGQTMSFVNVEQFTFNQQSFSLGDLQSR